jgi:hypothetical protein
MISFRVPWRKSCLIYFICNLRPHQNYQARKDFRFPRFLHIRMDYFTHSPCTHRFFPRLPYSPLTLKWGLQKMLIILLFLPAHQDIVIYAQSLFTSNLFSRTLHIRLNTFGGCSIYA